LPALDYNSDTFHCLKEFGKNHGEMAE